MQIASRLELSQSQHGFHGKPVSNTNGDINDSHSNEVAALQLEAVMDLPVVNNRPGLYVLLNSLVSLILNFAPKTTLIFLARCETPDR